MLYLWLFHPSMFTGIIEEVGKIRKVTSQGMWINVSFARELKLGQSVACNGVCLTVVEADRKGFAIELLEETKRRTSFVDSDKDSLVNLERAMKVGDRFDGHIVLAHSEGVGKVMKMKVKMKNEDRVMTLKVPKPLMRYMILKGIVVLDGIALTLTRVDDKKAEIEVAIIPHTWENTNLSFLKIGARVNVETDVVGKWIEKLAS